MPNNSNDSERFIIGEKDALVVVDVQNDFLPGGALSVSEGDEIIDPLNAMTEIFIKKGRPVFFTRDWHPGIHCSFGESGGPWPPHCVQGTTGAKFAENLTVPTKASIISKGFESEEDQYSTAYGVDDSGRTLETILKEAGTRRVFIGGLATDYCVLNSVLDFLKAGFSVYVLIDAVRAVNVDPKDGQKAMETMKAQGAEFTETDWIG